MTCPNRPLGAGTFAAQWKLIWGARCAERFENHAGLTLQHGFSLPREFYDLDVAHFDETAKPRLMRWGLIG